ncbi:hypothetical protein XELAEV_18021203mg [Xenopus laevis]|uniref:Uncharacterized protein n=1 Tax=Xenopus laevis TaxID=8355 RepID=A0A974D8R7_XENLA|nr:hypothetical protein XELAEV_18021203mg [Xenopus laevis]
MRCPGWLHPTLCGMQVTTEGEERGTGAGVSEGGVPGGKERRAGQLEGPVEEERSGSGRSRLGRVSPSPHRGSSKARQMSSATSGTRGRSDTPARGSRAYPRARHVSPATLGTRGRSDTSTRTGTSAPRRRHASTEEEVETAPASQRRQEEEKDDDEGPSGRIFTSDENATLVDEVIAQWDVLFGIQSQHINAARRQKIWQRVTQSQLCRHCTQGSQHCVQALQ